MAKHFIISFIVEVSAYIIWIKHGWKTVYIHCGTECTCSALIQCYADADDAIVIKQPSVYEHFNKCVCISFICRVCVALAMLHCFVQGSS